jgi:hypothetical protein
MGVDQQARVAGYPRNSTVQLAIDWIKKCNAEVPEDLKL